MSQDPATYHPHGEMCMTCQHALRNCSALPFHTMRVIERYAGGLVVRCTGYAKAEPVV